MILGADVSHFQGLPNFGAVKSSGRDFVVIKATEGTGFTDPNFTVNRRNAHAAGLIVGLYHFARAGDVAKEAAYFVATIGALQPGEFLVLDWEVSSGNPVGWCSSWLAAVHSATGVAPLIYMNQSAVKGSNWSSVAGTYGLWLAVYDNSTTQPTVPYWSAPAMKQFSDKGTVPGIAGTCDVDVFYGTAAQLLAYGKSGSTDDMTPEQARQLQAVYDALFTGGSSMPDGQKSLPQSLVDTRNAILGFLQDTTGADLRLIVGKVGDLATAATPEALAAAIVTEIGTLPAVDADKVAALVIAGLGQRINTPPPA